MGSEVDRHRHRFVEKHSWIFQRGKQINSSGRVCQTEAEKRTVLEDRGGLPGYQSIDPYYTRTFQQVAFGHPESPLRDYL